MRRIVAITTITVALAATGAGCRHDGRTLREPKPGQDGSVSSPPVSTDDLDGEAFFDTVAPTDAISTEQPTTSTVAPSTAAPTTSVASTAALKVTAPWADGAAIDARYTCDGANVAPALSWPPAPAGTAEIAVGMTDDDAPFHHWLMAGIAPDAAALAEGEVPTGAMRAVNGSGAIGYTGPCPPSGTHTYRITVYYLQQAMELGDGADYQALAEAIGSTTISSAVVTGTYTRP